MEHAQDIGHYCKLHDNIVVVDFTSIYVYHKTDLLLWFLLTEHVRLIQEKLDAFKEALSKQQKRTMA